MRVVASEGFNRERSIVGDVLRHHGTLFTLGSDETQGIWLAPQLGALRDCYDIVAPATQLDRRFWRPHRVEQNLHRRNRS